MDFALYVSSKEGHLVHRYGAPIGTYIGATRVGKKIEWNEKLIVPIPEDEYRRYRAEYDDALGVSLTKRSREEYEAQQKARTEAKKKAQSATADAAKPQENR